MRSVKDANRTLFVGAAAAAIGAGAMYFWDPHSGNRRRALVRGKAKHFFSHARRFLPRAAADLEQRAVGFVHELGEKWKTEEIPDQVLEARARSAIGRLTTHPRAITIKAKMGKITLQGPVLLAERAGIIDGIASVHGVREIDDHLFAHSHPGNIPDLQGSPSRKFRQGWKPGWPFAVRASVGSVGGALAAYGLVRRSPRAKVLGTVGAGILLRALANRPMSQLFSRSRGPSALSLQKTVHLDIPIEEAYGFWSDFENFPKFMSHVKQVRVGAKNSSQWDIGGPAGSHVTWEAQVTSAIPNRLFAWQTRPGSLIQHAGIAHFERSPDGGTRIHLRLRYHPPGGVLGKNLATIFGANPKKALDEDMIRMKTFLEKGRPARDAAANARR